MRFGLLAILMCSFGCVSDISVDDASFPCRSQEDCAEGFVCAPVRFICVSGVAPEPNDGGVADGAPMDASPQDAQSVDVADFGL